MRFMKKGSASVLALAVDEHSARAAIVSRNDGIEHVEKCVSFPMSLNVLNEAADLVGIELRGHLSAAGISTRRCVICVPARWLVGAHLSIPDMPESDVRSFIELQAERQFPISGDEIVWAASRYSTPKGERGSFLLAISKNRLHRIHSAAQAAGLHIAGVTSSAAALSRWNGSPESAVLSLVDGQLELAVAGLGGLICLRGLGEVHAEPAISLNGIGRDLRVSLRRLPQALGSQIHTLKVYGSDARVQPLIDEVQAALGAPGIIVQEGTSGVRSRIPGAQIGCEPALVAVADLALRGTAIEPNFLPAKASRLDTLLQFLLKRRATTLLGGAAATILLLVSAFAIQNHTLRRLEGELRTLAPRVEVAAAAQERIRLYRDWTDAGAPTLDIMRALAETFPEAGIIWTRSVRIVDGSTVTCSGRASDNAGWLAMLEALRETAGVRDVQVSQVRGDRPMEFSFGYTWTKETQ